MQAIPQCDVIEQLLNAVNIKHNIRNNIKKTAFVGVQHFLNTTLSLFYGLIQYGAMPYNLFFI